MSEVVCTRLRLHLMLLLVALIPWKASGIHADDLSSPSPSLSFRAVHDSRDRLPAPVTSMATGPDGFLWLGTRSGLVRYDGYEFLRWDRFCDPECEPNEPGPADTAVTAVLGSSGPMLNGGGGELWVAVEAKGLYRYEPATRTFRLSLDQEAIGSAVSALARAADGTLVVGTRATGVLFVSASGDISARLRNDPTAARTLSSDRIAGLATGESGELYVATVDRGLNLVSAGRRTVDVERRLPGVETALPSDRLRAIAVDARGRVWVGAADGSLAVRPSGERSFDRVLEGRRGPAVTSFLADRGGRLWVGRQNASTLRVGPELSIVEAECAPDARSLYEDPAGVVWAATGGPWLRRRLPGSDAFATLLAAPCEATAGGRSIWAITGDEAGRLWFAGASGTLATLELAAGFLSLHDALPAGARVLSAEAVRDGVWLALDEAGAALVSPDGTVIARIAQPGLRVLSLLSVGERIVLGTGSGELITVDRSGMDVRSDPAAAGIRGVSRQFARPGPVTALAAAGSDRIWVGGTRMLLSYDTVGRDARAVDLSQALPGELVVWGLAPREDGSVWVAAGRAGLILAHPEEGIRRRLVPGDDFSAQEVFAVVEDGRGAAWFTTDAGLFRLDGRTGRLERFTRARGLAADAFNAGAFYAAANGKLYAGGPNGVTEVDPALASRSRTAARIVPTSLSASAEIASGARSTIHTRTRALALTFAAVPVPEPSTVGYEYALLTSAGREVARGTGREFLATDLDSGSYRLRVRATYPDGSAAAEPLELTVRVAVPFGTANSLLIVTGAGLLAALVLILAMRRRLARLREEYARAALAVRSHRHADRYAEQSRREREATRR